MVSLYINMIQPVISAIQSECKLLAHCALELNFRIITIHVFIHCLMIVSGPTLLFAQTDSEGDVTDKFYACSACRDRKDCQFYQQYDKSVSEEKKRLREEIYVTANEYNKHYQYCIDRCALITVLSYCAALC